MTTVTEGHAAAIYVADGGYDSANTVVKTNLSAVATLFRRQAGAISRRRARYGLSRVPFDVETSQAVTNSLSREVTLPSDNDDMLHSNDGGIAVAGEFESVTYDEPAAADAESDTKGRPDVPIPSDLLHLPFAEARARALEQFDRQFLSAALARHNGNIARTARALGLHRQSLQKLMARRSIKSVRPAPAPTSGTKV